MPQTDGSPDFSRSADIAQPDWQAYCQRTAELILSEQSPAQLLAVRARLYELLVHAIPASLIFKTLTECIVNRVDDTLRASIAQKAAFYVRSCEALALTPTGAAQRDGQQTHLPPRGIRGAGDVPAEVTPARYGLLGRILS